jgi:tetratricopeptide (TPR) repeat protein
MFLQRHDEALAAFRRALEMNPAYDDAAYAAAQTLVSLDRHEEAAGFLAGILERDPGNALALAEMGRVHWSAGRYDKALEFYRRAVDEESWNPEFRLNLGMTLASLGRMGEAADAGLEAARFDPDNPAIWDFLRNAGREAGRKALQDEAMRQLDRLRSSRP